MSAGSGGTTWPLIGHMASIDRLRQMVARTRVPTALLFTGPTRIGRRAVALELARAVLCPHQVDGVACGRCVSCRRVTSGNHPDLDFWDVARQEEAKGQSRSGALTIETVREITLSATHRPYEANQRVIVLDDAETLGEEQQQALLKTLEDAPAFVSIVLISSSVDAIIGTVRSRVVDVPFQLVPSGEIAEGIRRFRPHGDAPEAIARLARGRAGWAVTAADDPSLIESEREAVDQIERWISGSRRDRLVEAYRRGEAVAQRRKSVVDVQEDLDQALLIWRDLLLSASGNVDIAFDPGRVERLVPTLSPDSGSIYMALAACRQCQFDLSHNVRPRLALELMVNQWPTLS